MYPAEGSLCRMPWWLSGEMPFVLLILPWVRIPAVTAFFFFFRLFDFFFWLSLFSDTVNLSGHLWSKLDYFYETFEEKS